MVCKPFDRSIGHFAVGHIFSIGRIRPAFPIKPSLRRILKRTPAVLGSRIIIKLAIFVLIDVDLIGFKAMQAGGTEGVKMHLAKRGSAVARIPQMTRECGNAIGQRCF